MNSSSWPFFRIPSSHEPAHEEHRLPATPPPAGLWIDWGPPAPESWKQDRAVLLVRDPGCIFACWELTGPHADWLPQRHGPDAFAQGRWRLRLFGASGLREDTPASHPLGSWYFRVEPDTAWRAEVGLLLRGEWIVVASAPEVRTPRADISPIVDEDWPVSEEEMLRQLGMGREEAKSWIARLREAARMGYPAAAKGPSSARL